MTDCTFCDEIKKSTYAINIPVVEKENFVVLADLAPVAFGHLIVLPRHHCLSMAELPPYLITEVTGIVEQLLRTASTAFDYIAIAEHGTSRTSAAHVDCVDHAHLHLCPLKEDPTAGIRLVENYAQSTNAVIDLAGLQTARNREYLLWGKNLRELSVWTPATGGCSQALRRVMNSLNGVPAGVKWQHAVSRDTAKQTARLFRHLLQE